MDKFGIFKEGKIIQKFDDRDEMFQEFLEMRKTNEGLIFRKLSFNELTEEEKLQHMEERLKGLKDFLEMAKGTGRAIRTDTSIFHDELEWLIRNTKKLNTTLQKEG